MSKWRVLITEPIHPVGTDTLAPVASWFHASGYGAQTLAEEMAGVDAVILRARGYVGPELMEAAPWLRVIGRHGVGVDNVDVEAATERGIWVVNTPEANAEAVAEHVFAMMLAFSRRIVQCDRATRKGDWDYRNRDFGFEVLGKTLGIVGMGQIGSRVAAIGMRAFSQQVLYTDAVARPEVEREFGARRVSLEELLAGADIVTVHVPATPETRGLLGRKQIARMRPGALFINCSRGAVVDEEALVAALESGHLGGACLDVFAVEPVPGDSRLLRLPNVLLSPHKAGQTEESMRRMALVAEDVVRVLQGETPRFPVNRPPRPREVRT
jgi:D-3-phosphoglycerate dehydrogenase